MLRVFNKKRDNQEYKTISSQLLSECNRLKNRIKNIKIPIWIKRNCNKRVMNYKYTVKERKNLLKILSIKYDKEMDETISIILILYYLKKTKLDKMWIYDRMEYILRKDIKFIISAMELTEMFDSEDQDDESIILISEEDDENSSDTMDY